MVRSFDHEELEQWSRLVDAADRPDVAARDERMQDLLDEALFDDNATTDERTTAMAQLIDYMWDEYGIDFEDVFDWESYREAYDSA
jgi:hypothetical protein